VFGELDDGELLSLSASHPDAFAEFYRRHAKDLLAFFVRRTFDPDAAAELTAETFAQAFDSRLRFRDRGQGGVGWLYGIARHQLSRYFRAGAVATRARQKLGLPHRALSEEDYDRIEELIDFEEVRGTVARAFGRLSAEQRRAMTLRVIEGRPYGEVARLLECTEDAARARVSRGLRRLTKLVGPQAPMLDLLEVEVGGSAP
jgi:RNA polymerase sigma-70 factor (ECF subfamily)